MTQQCTACKLVLPLDSFYRNKNGKNGRLTQCKACFVYRHKKLVKNPMGYPRYRKYPLELIKEGLAMRAEGFSHRVIEAEIGIPKGALQNYEAGRVSFDPIAKKHHD